MLLIWQNYESIVIHNFCLLLNYYAKKAIASGYTVPQQTSMKSHVSLWCEKVSASIEEGWKLDPNELSSD